MRMFMTGVERDEFAHVARLLTEAAHLAIRAPPAQVVAKLEELAMAGRSWWQVHEKERLAELQRPSRRRLRGLAQLSRSR